MEGFKKFLLRGNVVDLAIGVVVGAAFNEIVTSFVKNLLTPVIAAIGGKPNFSSFVFNLNGAEIHYGDFLNSVISFLIIATVIYFVVVLPMNKLRERREKKSDPTTKECPYCFSEIPIKAIKCPECTSDLKQKGAKNANR